MSYTNQTLALFYPTTNPTEFMNISDGSTTIHNLRMIWKLFIA